MMRRFKKQLEKTGFHKAQI